ncbi:hypothetical protein K491DRAFT_569367, partial [Lophiostoma macrostomum CBS 122681]
NHNNHIDKLAFLSNFRDVFRRVFTSTNIQSSFQLSRIILNNLDIVLSKLDVRLKTPLQ